jgi:hypothetical protein
MSNKLIDKERIKELWEEIKMLDVLEVAREKGMEEGIEAGKTLGIQEGKTLGMVEMLLKALFEKFGVIPPKVSIQIRNIDNKDAIDTLFSQVFRCADMAAFENVLRQVVADDVEKKPS